MSIEPWLAAIAMALASLLGLVLAAITLPGAWLMLIVAGLIQWWAPGSPSAAIGPVERPFDWWTLGACVGIALFAELIEFAASAIGASKAGGSKRAAIASAIGSVIGAILGSPFFLIIGAIIGGVIGAAAGAIIAERAWVGKSWEHSAKVGQGAAIGRLIATVVKTAAAGVIAVTLTIAVVVP